MRYLYLFLFIANFLIFGYDIENDRDFYTWVWLLSSIINLITFLKLELKEIIHP